jgi:hypothetical protein
MVAEACKFSGFFLLLLLLKGRLVLGFFLLIIFYYRKSGKKWREKMERKKYIIFTPIYMRETCAFAHVSHINKCKKTVHLHISASEHK